MSYYFVIYVSCPFIITKVSGPFRPKLSSRIKGVVSLERTTSYVKDSHPSLNFPPCSVLNVYKTKQTNKMFTYRKREEKREI